MENDIQRYAKQLMNFETVWKRVAGSKSASAAAQARGVELKPGAKRPNRSRFSQGR